MSASPTSSSASQTAEQRAHEPSMEEILASIRRIIADDQMLPLSRPASAVQRPMSTPLRAIVEDADADSSPPEEPVPVASEARDLDYEPEPEPEVTVTADLRRSFPAMEPPSVARVAEPAPPPPQPSAPPPRREAPAASAAAPEVDDSIVSASTGASVSSAFNALATTMFLQNTGMVEEAIRDLLRPMLKQWLDDNLPVMVERLVRSEIERVARGGR